MADHAPQSEVEDLRRRLEEADEALRAIRTGEVDALVVDGPGGERVFTLEGADHPYRVLIEAMEQGAVSLGADGTVLYCNRCFAGMLRRPLARVIGAKVADFLPAAEATTFDAMLRQSLMHSSHGELQFLLEDGTALPVYAALAPLALGGAVAVCMVITDLTERKEHQHVREASRRKDEFLAMLAHELRNPLAPIRHAVALLHLLESPDEKVGYAREIIERQIQQLTRLVDDLLDVSRITLGKVALQPERVELADVVYRADETCRPLIESRRHRLKIAVPPRGCPLVADPARVAQVIGNLLTNAAKYTEEGGEIVLSARRDGPRVAVSVRDNGMGIPPELLPRIFDLFTQGERTLARSEGGLGIGLTLVRSLVEMHGGSVEARSDGPGRGSEFIVRLPAAADAPAARPDGPRAEGRGAPAGRRILVVDDNRDGAESLAMLLRLLGHQVRVAYTGTEALDAAGAYRPQVLLLDIGLPGLNGYEVARRLRAAAEFEQSLFVAMTGYGQEEDRRRSREAGFDHHLVKPVDLEVLKGLLAAGEPVAC